MKILKELLKGLSLKRIVGSTSVAISSIHDNSLGVTSGSLFIALKGENTNGHDFISDAISKGAVAIICEDLPNKIMNSVTYVQVEKSTFALGLVASSFYDHPSRYIKLIGVTGTNGKTSTVYYLSDLFTQLKFRVGMISTIENRIDNTIYSTTHTTPGPITLNKLLFEMVDKKCDFCFMEVSSHGIAQNRIAGLSFDVGVFTNISRDHLDYHDSFNEYVATKKQFFDQLSQDAISIINMDDTYATNMVLDTKSKPVFFSFDKNSHYQGSFLESNINGLSLKIDNVEISTQLPGYFNGYNMLSAYVVASELKQDKKEVLTLLSNLKSVPGRFNIIKSKSNITGVVDYAHTPDALRLVLKTVSSLCDIKKDLIVVVGCGGNRDKGKRPLMGKIAAENSRISIFTSDNPRWENPDRIIEDMCTNLSEKIRDSVKVIINREEAIHFAVKQASPGTVILLAGKGHEKFQESNGVKLPFDDFLILENYLKT